MRGRRDDLQEDCSENAGCRNGCVPGGIGTLGDRSSGRVAAAAVSYVARRVPWLFVFHGFRRDVSDAGDCDIRFRAMNDAAPGIQLTPTAHDALSSAAASARAPPPGLCPGNRPLPIEVSKAFAYQVTPTTKITSAQTDNKARMPNRTGNEPADRRIVRSCRAAREIVNPEALQHPMSWTSGSGRLLDCPVLPARREAWPLNAGVWNP